MKIKKQRKWRRRSIQEQQNISFQIIGWLIWILLFLFGILAVISFFIASDQTKEQDKRASYVLSESIQDAADMKLSDEWIGRDFWVRMATNWKRLTGSSRVGDIYLTEERLLECPSPLDSSDLSKTADFLNQFYEDYQVPTFVIAVPSAGEFYASELLYGVPFPSQISEIDQFYDRISSPIRKIDVYRILFTTTDDYIYNRTDPRWTCYGAYCVYRNTIRKMGFTPISYDQYAVSHVDTYRGSLYDQCLYDKVTPDILDVYTCESGSTVTDITAYLANGTQESRTMYTKEAQMTDPYSYYLGDACEKCVIETDVGNQKKLLLIGDSYADCMVPFLLQHYSEICFLNLICMEHTLEELVQVSDYSQVLILCDADTFTDTTHFEKLLPAS